MTDVLPCLIHVELLHAVSGLRTSVSVTWQRTCCLDTTRCFLFPLDQTGPGLKDLYLWRGGWGWVMMSAFREAVNLNQSSIKKG